LLSEIEEAKIIDNCVLMEKILSASLSDSVFQKAEEAYDRHFTHIPIIDENNRCIGIFSHTIWSKILLDTINNANNIKLDNSLTFGDILDYLSFDKQVVSEIVFLSSKSTVFDAKVKTSQSFNERQRGVGMFLITENGTDDEPLLGLITPVGLLGRKILN